jgi:hypothetical protein
MNKNVFFLPYILLCLSIVIGLFTKEFVGYVSFGLFIAALSSIPIMIIDLLKRPNFFSKESLVLWGSFIFISILFPVIFKLDLSIPDSMMVTEYTMLALSFPFGLLSSIFHYQLEVEGIKLLIFTWGSFAILGFFQWFIILPLLKRIFTNQWQKLKGNN